MRPALSPDRDGFAIIGLMGYFDDPHDGNHYRRAYGEAANMMEASRFDHSWGRVYAAKVPGVRDEILRAVLEKLGDDRRELVEMAVDDALEGLKPKW